MRPSLVSVGLLLLAGSLAPLSESRAQSGWAGAGLFDPRPEDMRGGLPLQQATGRLFSMVAAESPLIRRVLSAGLDLLMYDRTAKYRGAAASATPVQQPGAPLLEVDAIDIPAVAKLHWAGTSTKAYLAGGASFSANFKCKLRYDGATITQEAQCNDVAGNLVERSLLRPTLGAGFEFRPAGAATDGEGHSRLGGGIGIDVRYTPLRLARVLSGSAVEAVNAGTFTVGIRLGGGR